MTDAPIQPSPERLVNGLLKLLTVKPIDENLFGGAINPSGVGRVFGGQVIAQALMAAQHTVSDKRRAHSLHAYFMRPGVEGVPITYQVERDFDGGSFSTRRVIAVQDEKPILNFACSFQRPETGLSHQRDMPIVPQPEDLKSERELRVEFEAQIPEQFREMFARPRAIEFRPVQPRSWMVSTKTDPVQQSWFRLSAPIGDDMPMHRAIIAYASDMSLLATGTLPHGLHWMRGELLSASLDHAIWFHQDCRVDDWLLYDCHSPWAGGARSMNLGSIYSRDGRLVATVTQEGLMRATSAKPK